MSFIKINRFCDSLKDITAAISHFLWHFIPLFHVVLHWQHSNIKCGVVQCGATHFGLIYIKASKRLRIPPCISFKITKTQQNQKQYITRNK